MAPRRVPGPQGGQSIAVFAGSQGERIQRSAPVPEGTVESLDELPGMPPRELRELAFDLLQIALDLAGIFDPTPTSDGIGCLVALTRGQWLDAVISGVSVIPYVGDLAKAGKLPRHLRTLERALAMAERSRESARVLTPGLAKLAAMLEQFPRGSNLAIDRMRGQLERFLKREAAPAIARQLPDIRRQFSFRGPTPINHGGKPYLLREAEGPLGIPGQVKNHAIPKNVQKSVSGGSGDDAGHLIGGQFGAPSDASNLSRQNWRQNQGGGSWHDMESAWAEKLKAGTGIRVKVKEFTPEGANRPLWREVEWEEIAPSGAVTKHRSGAFLNTHTADAPHRSGSRTQQNIPSRVTEPQSNNVYDIRTGKRID